ncbi:hypothetical protein [Streptomyces sp. NBC_00989]|uniref:hypothetical protein n=1 Tax=Streptomyces sp. NBC_00989 TaxID=2903705 RepID=UPI00386965DC|nr:hypothetical protein OG714_02395 [Streptomyces sp. NBC_00989]
MTTLIMTGVRLGLGRTVTGMVIVELLMVSLGFGGLILEYRSRFEAPRRAADCYLPSTWSTAATPLWST